MTEIQPFAEGWAIVIPKRSGKPWIVWASVNLTRRDAIDGVLSTYALGYEPTWKQLYRQGFRAIKVRIDPR